jgi:hypothetical protein
MIHWSCGNGLITPCLDNNGKYTKGFPNSFGDTIGVEGNGYPIYRRRSPGPLDPNEPKGPFHHVTSRKVKKKQQQSGTRGRRSYVFKEIPVDKNQCQKFDCHINV